MKKLLQSNATAAILLIRILVGGVFLAEGINKFVYPDDYGAGRFTTIGFTNPEQLAAFVAVNEIVFGILVLLGLFTRISVIPLLIIMAVAITRTKIPILVDDGFLKMMHASRNDLSMTFCSLFLLILGAGPLSMDRFLLRTGLTPKFAPKKAESPSTAEPPAT